MSNSKLPHQASQRTAYVPVKWRKTAVIVSLIWSALVVIGLLIMIRRLDEKMPSAEERETKKLDLLEMGGYFLVGGNVALWAFFWRRAQSKEAARRR